VGLPYLNPTLGNKVATRQITWKEMAIRAWGSEYAAPDHRIYVFSNGRAFDSTDRLTTGIYNHVPQTSGFPPGGKP
jgi:hypothetical protein